MFHNIRFIDIKKEIVSPSKYLKDAKSKEAEDINMIRVY